MVSIPGPSQFAKYIGEIRAFIGIVVALFVLSAALGYVIPGMYPEVVDALLSGLQDKADQLTGQQPLLMMLGIFWNNAFASLLALIFGLAAGLFPLFFVMSNGIAIGIVLEMIVAKMGASVGILVFVAGILPHGIIELPAVLISASIGLKLGYHALLSLIKRQDMVTGELMSGLRIFVFWIVPMLFVAAFIETFITSLLLGSV
jgi:stage II sporulation protein M